VDEYLQLSVIAEICTSAIKL